MRTPTLFVALVAFLASSPTFSVAAPLLNGDVAPSQLTLALGDRASHFVQSGNGAPPLRKNALQPPSLPLEKPVFVDLRERELETQELRARMEKVGREYAEAEQKGEAKRAVDESTSRRKRSVGGKSSLKVVKGRRGKTLKRMPKSG